MAINPEESKKQSIRITFNRDKVLAPAIRSVRLASEMVTICYSAIHFSDLNNLSHADFLGLSFPKHEDVDVVRVTYKAWMLTKAFQELATGLRTTLEEAYKYSMGLNLGHHVFDWGSFRKEYLAIERKAQRMNFPDLLDAVQSAIGTDLRFHQELKSLQKVRNCLEHRSGIVGDPDCKEDGYLVLRLPRLKIFTINGGGVEVEIYGGQYFPEGALIHMRRDIRVRTYAKGQKVDFTPEEFSEIAFAIYFMILDLYPKLPGKRDPRPSPAP